MQYTHICTTGRVNSGDSINFLHLRSQVNKPSKQHCFRDSFSPLPSDDGNAIIIAIIVVAMKGGVAKLSVSKFSCKAEVAFVAVLLLVRSVSWVQMWMWHSHRWQREFAQPAVPIQHEPHSSSAAFGKKGTISDKYLLLRPVYICVLAGALLNFCLATESYRSRGRHGSTPLFFRRGWEGLF